VNCVDESLAERVLVLAPTRRDGTVTRDLLGHAGLRADVCMDLPSLVEQLEQGLGVLMLTDVALGDPQMAELIAALQQQPPWSDVPVVLLTQDRDRSPAAMRSLAQLSNVTLLERPTSTRTMISSVLAALRARRRQYEIRDHLKVRQAAEQALRDADQRKDEFLATLAHELRNPLAPLRTGLQLMARESSGRPTFDQLHSMMERQIGLLVKLIDELLDISRISTGKLVLQSETVDMRDVVQAAIEGSQPAIDAGRHELRVARGDEPLWVRGDPQRLAQIISNLLNNAAKYTPRGGLIRIEAGCEDGDIVVHVIDNGAGIPPHMLDSVFAMFTQVNRTLEHAQGGLGIGLSLVRRLTELHGGSVRASSDGADRGSTFTIRIPAVGPPCASTDADSAGMPLAQRGLRVLVVDDNVDAADTLAEWLRSAGCASRAVYTGEHALEVASEFAPEVVFCDIGLPGIDGHEVASRLRSDQRHARTVLVAVTGWGTQEDRRRTRGAGFDFHLVKPVRVESVAEILAGA